VKVLLVRVGNEDVTFYVENGSERVLENRNNEEPGLDALSMYLEFHYNYEPVIISVNDYEELSSKIKLYNPDIVGFTSYLYNIKKVLKFSKLTKDEFNIPICLGGIAATAYYDDIIKVDSGLDFIVVGEGEIPFSQLIKCIQNDDLDYSNIPNLIYKTDNGYIKNEYKRQLISLDDDIFPKHKLLYKKVEFAFLSSSRGCVKNCSFCISRNFWGKWRGRCIKSIIDEIVYIIDNFGIVNFFITDNSFEDPSLDRTFSILEEIRKRDLNIVLRVFMRPETMLKINENQFNLLRSSGIYNIYLGVESGNEKDLILYNKPHTLEQNNSAINILKKEKIGCQNFGFINLNPYSDYNTLFNNANFLNQNSCFTIKKFMSIYKNFKGTSIYNRIQEDGLLKDQNYLDFDNTTNYNFVNIVAQKFYDFNIAFANTKQFIFEQQFSNFYIEHKLFIYKILRYLENYKVQSDKKSNLISLLNNYLDEVEKISENNSNFLFEWAVNVINQCDNNTNINTILNNTEKVLCSSDRMSTYNDLETKIKRIILQIYKFNDDQLNKLCVWQEW